MLDIHRLRVFLAVCETGSFSRAAKEINLTQPTVSGHVKALEDYLGTPLFHRNGKQIRTTKAGEMLEPRARQIVNITKSTERQMAMFLGLKKGCLDIGGSNVPGQYILPELISRFKEAREDVNLTVRIGDTMSVTCMVSTGVIEIGMVGAENPDPDLEFTACFRDELVPAIPVGHTLANKKAITLKELSMAHFLIREPGSGTRKTIEQALAKQNIHPLSTFNIVAELGSAEAIRQAVKAGAGCAIISRRVIHDDLLHGAVVTSRLEGLDLIRQFYLVTSRSTTLSPLAESFKDFVLSADSSGINI